MATQGINKLSHDLAAGLDAIFAKWDRPDSPGCAVGIYRDGEIAFTGGYGMANLEHGIPITPDSIFHVASISKQFTALCIALLVQEGKLSLDDEVRTYVPEVPEFGQTITIRHLIHHVSGLRDQWDLLHLAGWRADDLITDQDVLAITSRQTALNFAPDDEHLYCNTGYTLQAVIVKRVTGKTLRQFAHDRIFEPLGMTRTHFHDDHTEIVPGRTQAYEPREGNGAPRISIPVFDTVGTTSLFTTVEDFFLWNQNDEHGRVGGDLLAQRLTPAMLRHGEQIAYAFGLNVHNRRGLQVVEHAGGDAGYRAHYLRVPEHRLGIAVFCNLSSMSAVELAEQVLELILGDRMTPEELPAVPPRPTEEELAAHAGVYRDAKTGLILTVTLREGKLVLPLYGDQTLEPIAPNRFRVESMPSIRLTFDPDRRHLLLSFGSPRPDVLERVDEPAPSLGQLPDFVGTFDSPELDTTYTFDVDDGALRWNRPKCDPTPLDPVLPDTFVGKGEFRFVFTRDAAGRVDGCTVGTYRVRRIHFSRR